AGLLLFSDEVEKYIPPKKGKNSVLRIVREILYYKPVHRKTSLQNALEYYYKMSKKRSIIFVISDFFDANFQKTLQIVAQKHDVVAIRILDPKEYILPEVGFITFQDAETGKEIIINANDAQLRKKYEEYITETIHSFPQLLKKLKIDLIDIRTHTDYIEDIVKFFKQRAKRYR
ncbi:MAG TPA: VWA domain-containing protein, partial [Candidatus Cloacimonetes bacterium]|nr:VWA domain-containing protein [Candidatus Cloacimonadota bacterium]